MAALRSHRNLFVTCRYWTDNQAYYDWYHWFPNVSREGKPQNVLLAIDAELTSKNLTAHYYQLDAYW
jgi:hypothetical protein